MRYADRSPNVFLPSLPEGAPPSESPTLPKAITDLGDQRQTWYAQVGLVFAKSASAWDASQQKMTNASRTWRAGYQQQYTDKSEAWRLSYLNFGQQKLDWVQQIETKAATAGNEAILSEVGASADDAMRTASNPMIASLSFDPQEANLQVEGLLSQVGSAQALTAIRRMNSGIATSQVMVASAGLQVDTRGARIAAEVKSFLAASRAEMATMAARDLADQAQDSVVQARKALTESVKKANEGFSGSMDYTFATAGYANSGGSYAREAIARTTLFDVVTEHQQVEGYRPYAMPVVQIDVDLSPGRLKGLQAEAVMDLVGIAQQEVSQAQKKIFGEGKDLTDQQKRAAGLLVDFRANGKTVSKEFGEGEFGHYLGYAPEFTDEPDFDRSQNRNIVVRGTGELGRLMGDFIWNQMKEGRGWTEMALPRWDKPLWDDTGSWFKAPSLRAVGTMGAALIAALVPGGQGLSAVLTSAAIATTATIAFDSLDVAYGYKSWEEAGLDIGKSFLTNAVSGTIGLGFKGIGSAWSGAGGTFGQIGQGVVGKTLLAGAQSFTTNVATSAINAINLHGGGIGFDTDAFKQGAFGKNAWANVASSAAAAGTAGLLDTQMHGFVNDMYKNGVNFDQFVGSIAGLGTSYAMTGEATLNVLNAADFGGPQYGLMEMHLGGHRDMSMNFGSSGTNVSGSTIAGAMKGLDAWGVNAQLAFSSQDEAQKYAVAMRTLASTGRGNDSALYQDLLAGRTNVVEDYSRSGAAETVAGTAGTKTIYLGQDSQKLGSDLGMGVIFSHEAYRNGISDGEQAQRLETNRAFIGHTQTALDIESAYGTGVLGGTMSKEAAALATALKTKDWSQMAGMASAYDSGSDFWKLMSNGDLIADKDGWLKDQNGNYVYKDGTRHKALDPDRAIGAAGIETGLVDILLGDGQHSDKDVQQVQALMSRSGMLHTAGNDPSAWMWGGSENGVPRTGQQQVLLGLLGSRDVALDDVNKAKRIAASSLLEGFGDTVATPVFMNGVDRLSDLAVFGGDIGATMAYGDVPTLAQERFAAFVAAKGDFYSGLGKLLDPKGMTGRSAPYGPNYETDKTGKPYYPDFQHKGIDEGAAKGTPVYALFNGEVARTNPTDTAGNNVILEYGFNFENSFYDTGVKAQFMHFMSDPLVQKGTIASAVTPVGYVGDTGKADGFHLHYQLMGDLGGSPGIGPTSPDWEMYRDRRNTFLNFVGAPPMSNWTSDPTRTLNYWSQDYTNYFFNTNELLKRVMGR